MLNEQRIIQLIDMSSRRMSTGMVGAIVGSIGDLGSFASNTIHSLMSRFSGPSNHFKIDPHSGIDVITGTAYVIPKADKAHVKRMLAEMGTNMTKDREESDARIAEAAQKDISQSKMDKILADESESLGKREEEISLNVYNSIKDHIILATVNPLQDNGANNASNRDIWVSSKEQAQSRAEFIPKRGIQQHEINHKWTELDKPRSRRN